MKIQNYSEVLRTERIESIRPAGSEAGSTKQAQTDPSAQRCDRIQISDAGPALAQRVDPSDRSEARAKLSPERTAEIRTRVLQGAYNSLEVVDQVARRMLESGDI